jgi:hypothetical protein
MDEMLVISERREAERRRREAEELISKTHRATIIGGRPVLIHTLECKGFEAWPVSLLA